MEYTVIQQIEIYITFLNMAYNQFLIVKIDGIIMSYHYELIEIINYIHLMEIKPFKDMS